jgi:hypothetical protein
MYNKIFYSIIIVISLFCYKLNAQCPNVEIVTINVPLPAPRQFSAYFSGSQSTVRILVQNKTQRILNARLFGEVRGNNGVTIKIPITADVSEPIQLQPMQSRLLTQREMEVFFNENIVITTGITNGLFGSASNSLPEGCYQMNLGIDDYDNPNRAIGFQMQCSKKSNEFCVKAANLPLLTFPSCNSTQPEKQIINFAWSTPNGLNANDLKKVDYEFQLIEYNKELGNANAAFGTRTDQVGIFFTSKPHPNPNGTSYRYDPENPISDANGQLTFKLELGKQYAWRVIASAKSEYIGEFSFENKGITPACLFTYGKEAKQDSTKKDLAVVPPYKYQCSCKADKHPDSTINNSAVIKNSIVTMAHGMKLLINEASASGNKLVGNGTAEVPMVNSALLRIQVTFNDLQVNGANQMLAGNVIARIKPGAVPGLLPGFSKPDLKSFEPKPSDILAIDNYLQSSQDKIVQAGAQAIAFDLPFGIKENVGGTNTTLAITDMTFTARDAYFGANAFVKTEEVSTNADSFDGIALRAKQVCLDKSGFCGQAILHLYDDVKLGALKLKGNPEADSAKCTYVVWDKGLKKLRIRATVELPSEYFQEIKTKKPVLVEVVADAVKWTDWLAVVTFPAFELKKDNDYTFSPKAGQAIWYDHSEVRNPNNGQIDAYLKVEGGDLGKRWMGFSMPEMDMTFPEIVKSIDNKKVQASVKDLIIDRHGLTGKFNADNLLTLDRGTLDGWFVSIDNLKGSFFKGGFQEAGMKGRVILPLSGSDTKNPKSQLDYLCTLTKDSVSKDVEFQFAIEVKEGKELDVPIWKANMRILKGSAISISKPQQAKKPADGKGDSKEAPKDDKNKNSKSDYLVQALLNGQMDLKAGGIDMTLMRFDSLTVRSKEPYFSAGHWKFSSPQKTMGGSHEADFVDFEANINLEEKKKKLGGFPLSITNIKPITGPNPAKGGMDAGLAFTVNVKLCELDELLPTASTSIRLLSVIKLAGERPAWEYNNVFVDSIKVDGRLGPLSVWARLAFFRDDPKMGDGFMGSAKVELMKKSGDTEKSGLGISANVLFGDKGYNYFYVDLMAKFPKPIPFATPLALAAIGGGLGYHVAPENPKTVNNIIANVYNASGKPQAPKYIPDASKGVNFTAAAMMCTQDGSMLNIIAQLNMSFKDNLVPDIFRIDGNAYMFTKVGQTKGFITGTAGMSYEFANNVLDGYATLNANMGTKGTVGMFFNGEMRLHIAVDDNQFFLKLGEPEKRIEAEAYLVGIKMFGMGAYMMVGNYDIPPMPKPYGLTDEQIQQIFGSIRQIPYDQNEMSSSLAGLAFGAGFQINTGKQNVGPIYFEFLAGAGFDIMLKQYTEGCNGKSDLPGIDGWYATGQVYAYIKLKAGIHVDIWVYEGDIDILELSAGALLRGGFVNPIWISGKIKGTYNVLNGLVKGSFEEEFTLGEICVPQRNPFANKPLIAAINPKRGDKNVNILTPVEVDFNYPINDILEIEAATSKGTEIQRYQLVFKDDKKFVFNNPSSKQDCPISNEGEIYFSQENYRATFYRSQAMQDLSNYEVTIGVQMNKLLPSGQVDTGWKFINDAQKDTTISFRTGRCMTALSKKSANPSLVANYPYDNQRYFLPKEGNGFLELAAQICCILPKNDPLYDLRAQFISTTDTLETAASVNATNTNFINYTIPDLKRTTIYKLRIVKKPKPNFMAILRQQNGFSSKYERNDYVSKVDFMASNGLASNVMASNSNAATVTNATQKGKTNSTEVSAIDGTNSNNNANVKVKVVRAVDGSISYQPQTVVLYQYYFKTSQFRTASEKLKAITGLGEVADKRYLDNEWGFDINYKSPEGFDTYDLGFQPVRFGGDKTAFKWPMFLFSDGGNRWGTEFRSPMYDKRNILKALLPNMVGDLVTITKFSNGDGIVIRSETDINNRMIIEPNSLTPERPLNYMEIRLGGPVENIFNTQNKFYKK